MNGWFKHDENAFMEKFSNAKVPAKLTIIKLSFHFVVSGSIIPPKQTQHLL
jgi:hypothetical protein